MKCKGCKHCVILHFPYDDSPRFTHYCANDAFCVDHSIGESYRFCKGEYYEPLDSKI